MACEFAKRIDGGELVSCEVVGVHPQVLDQDEHRGTDGDGAVHLWTTGFTAAGCGRTPLAQESVPRPPDRH